MLPRLFAPALAFGLWATAAFANPGTVTIGMALEPPNLDPSSGAAAAIDEVVYANIFQGLTKFGPDGMILPDLAQAWDVSEDGAVYTFHLVPGVTFHDGTAFDAEDVKFTLDRARGSDSTNAQKALFAGIEQVEVVDPLTVQVTLAAPDGAFAFKMAWGDAVMMAPETAASATTNPVGTGPYRFRQWVRGDHIVLDLYPGYRGPKPAIERATFRFITDPTAAYAAMMSGDVDVFPIFPSPETLTQFESDPQFKVIIGTTEGETILAMNNRNAPLSDRRVREAIAHAIDRREIINGAMFGYGRPIGSHFAPHHPNYVDTTAISAYDPDRSRALLNEAGVHDLTLRLALPPPAYARRGGEIIAAQLAAVGIKTQIVNLEWASWLEQVFRNHDFDLTIVSHTEPFDLNIYARPDYYFGYDNPDYAALIDRLDRTTDSAERARMMREAQEVIARDYVNAFLFQLAKTGVAKAGLEGLWLNAPTPANDISALFWAP